MVGHFPRKQGEGRKSTHGQRRQEKKEEMGKSNITKPKKRQIFKQDEVIKEVKARREACHHSPEHRELPRNSGNLYNCITEERQKNERTAHNCD